MDKTQFWIEGYSIDLSRNQITKNNQTHSYPPKVMAVLAMLVEYQGQVVSFDALLKRVWKDRVVSTNTLQRCIFQLRQAFNDNSKSQRVIKTHAKQGYSLESPIRDEPCNTYTTSDKSINTDTAGANSLNWSGIVLFAVFISILGIILSLQYNQKTSFSKVNTITSSDDWESNGSYSADGRFILFQRHVNNCYNHLWAKDLVSQQEYKLTDRAGIYGRPDWSPDGNQITFVERKGCPHENASTNYCWSVNSLAVIDGVTKPQVPVSRLECEDKPTWQAQWLPHGQIGFLRISNGGSPIFQVYNPKTGQIRDLYKLKENYIYGYDFSLEKEQFAILSISKTNTHQIDIVNIQGQIKSSNPITLPSGVSALESLAVQYHPSGKHLITSTSSGLFKLFENGEMQQINMAERHRLYDPSYNPISKRVVATEVITDTDNVMLSLNDIDIKAEVIKLSDFHFARSNLSEDNPKFQPNGGLIAFTSKRTGKRQLWIYDDKSQLQISRLEKGIQSKDIAWSPSGKRIATLASDSLHVFTLDGQFETIPTKLPIGSIMQWYNADEMLVLAREGGKEQLYLFNLQSSQFTNLNGKNVVWASLTDSGQLILFDSNERFWFEGEEQEEIKMLFHQLEQGRAVINGQSLFGINKQMQLWAYSLEFDSFEIIAQLPESARYVSDVKGNQLLMTHMNKLQKDLVELY
jgi:transcriptional activator of cad operon